MRRARPLRVERARMLRLPATSCLFVLLAATSALAQHELPEPRTAQLDVRGAAPLTYRVQPPAGFAEAAWHSLVVLVGDGAIADAAGAAIAAQGFIVAHTAQDRALPALFAALRQQFRIAGGGMHLVAIGAAVGPTSKIIETHGWQLQSAALFGGELVADLGPWQRVAGRSGVWFTDAQASPDDPASLRSLRRAAVDDGELAAVAAQQVANARASRAMTGAAAEVDRALDDFHDAASSGDAERYFRLLPDDAVFLGTDATERWTGAQFREFALPYFKRGSAWIYVPVSRHIEVGADGAFAWFDEVLDNESYGECRGSGVFERRGDRWVVRQYNLVIPVPNDLARGLVERARALARGAVPAVTTIVVVRHGERGEGDDPELDAVGAARSERLRQMLATMPLTAVFASEYRRTQATVAPTAQSKGLATTVHKAGDMRGLAARIRSEHAGGAVLVAGHSNTVGPLLRGLGVAEKVALTEQDYGDLFVVVLSIDGAKLVRLKF